MTESTPVLEGATENDKTNYAKLIRQALQRKGLICLCALAGGLIGLAAAFLITPRYTAEATFLPPGSASSSSSVLLGQLGQLGALGGAAGGFGGLKDPSLIYIGILESRSVADDLIGQFQLNEVYHTTKLSETEKMLAKHTKFLPGKDTLVTVSVDDYDAQRAADMANAYLKALAKQNDRLALTEAGQRRAFFERQLEQQKDLLADAEADLSKTQQQTGLISPTGQTQVQLMAIAQTQAAISSREIQYSAMSQGATNENAEMIRLRSEISSLKEQLVRLENPKGGGGTGNPMVPTSKVPALTLEFARKQREVKYHEDLYVLLLRQFETAKLDESHAAPLVQIVDNAVVPDTKSWPPRTLFTLGAAMLGTAFGIVWVVKPAMRGI